MLQSGARWCDLEDSLEASPAPLADNAAPRKSFADLFPAKGAVVAAVVDPPTVSRSSVPSQRVKVQASAPIDFSSNVASWAQLTKSLGGQAIEENQKKTDEITKQLDFSEEMPAARFDPELDCSRDGLPGLFKATGLTEVASLGKVDEEEDSKHGLKRKNATETPKTNAWGSNGLADFIKGGENSSKISQPIASTPKAQKKQKIDEPQKIRQLVNPAISFASIVCPTTPKKSSSPLAETPRAKIPPPKPNSQADKELQRKKQLDLGKRTLGYAKYLNQVPRTERTAKHLNTPDVKKECSKRSWDGLVRQWRRFLHSFDEKIAGETEREKAERENREDREEQQEATQMNDGEGSGHCSASE